MAHTCTNALVRCIDFRLESAIEEYMSNFKLTNDTDIISLAGASKEIAQNDGSYAEGQVDLSKKLHDIKTVILMNHTDCGGYGGHEAFENEEAEIAKHTEDLHAAKDKLAAKYSELEVKLALAVIQDDGVISIKEIA